MICTPMLVEDVEDILVHRRIQLRQPQGTPARIRREKSGALSAAWAAALT